MARHSGKECSDKPQQGKQTRSNPGSSESAEHSVLKFSGYLIAECLETRPGLLSKLRRCKLGKLSQVDRLRLNLARIHITSRTLQSLDDGLMELGWDAGVILHDLNRVC